MRRVLVVVMALAVLAACNDRDDTPALKPFTADDAHFRGLFPGEPKRSDQEVPTAAGDLRLVQYTSEVRATYGFSVGWFQLASPLAEEGVRPFLESTQRGSVTAVEGELKTSEYVTAYGGTGIEYVAKMKSGPYVKARNVVVGKDVYILQMITDKKDAPQYREFVDGFQILPAAPD